jgi:ornithine carbamoyltransferase
LNRHLLTLRDVSSVEIDEMFTITERLKTKLQQGIRESLLPSRVAALLFEKPSLRTRVSFETAMTHLGGSSLYLGADVGWGTREAVSDFARVLSQYVDIVICRTKTHRRVEEMAEYSTCPVINGLTNLAHPCQALADLYTIREQDGQLRGKRLAYVGDANNVARSLLLACARMGVRFSIATPKGYEFSGEYVAEVRKLEPGLDLLETHDPVEAVEDADAVYTDVWTSMGQEAEEAARAQAFADFQVNGQLMQHAAKSAIFLHCLPARRNAEVTDQVIDGPQSAVVQQAGNRMHVQKAVIAWYLAGKA